MKKFTSMLLVLSLILVSCPQFSTAQSEELSNIPEFKRLSDPALLQYTESIVYDSIVDALNNDGYFVENVRAVYISQEYITELAYNSRANVFFGYTLAELDAQFQGTKYIFTLGEDGQTAVKPFEAYTNEYEQILKNVAIGTGVILIAVTVSVVSAGVGAPAVSMIFAAAAKTGTTFALSGAALGGVSAGIVTGIQTGDMDAALKSAAMAGSEGFKWGAISGAVIGGGGQAIALKGATLNGLTMNQAAAIQRESKYPLDVIKQFSSMEQYEICKNAGLMPELLNNKTALVRNIDLNFVDEATNMTNLQRMQQGLAALDPTGNPYQLHHIGQKMDSTLAILTRSEHMQGGNNTIWHEIGKASEINRDVFNLQRTDFWKELGSLLSGGM